MSDRARATTWNALARGAIALSAFVGTNPLAAQGIGGHNSNAPVNFDADRIELQDRDNRVLLTGNVDITQTDLRLRAARVTVSYANGDSLQVQRMIAGGGVTVVRGTETARGDVAVYDFNQRIITMAGNVALKRSSGDTLNGGRLVINLVTGVSSVDGKSSNGSTGAVSKGGRVSGQFSVPKRN